MMFSVKNVSFPARTAVSAVSSVTELVYVCLVVSQTLEEGAFVQMFCSARWHVRTALRFALWD